MHAAGVLTETTAELAASLTFAAARRIVEGDRYMRKGQYMGWGPTLMVGQLLQVRQLLLCAGRPPLPYMILDSPIVPTWLFQRVRCRRSAAYSACCWQLAKWSASLPSTALWSTMLIIAAAGERFRPAVSLRVDPQTHLLRTCGLPCRTRP